jgi:DNA-binding transcriptional LysR family regulator
LCTSNLIAGSESLETFSVAGTHEHFMDFDQLLTFLEVAKLGSFSRAGEKVYRSQSAVSAQIRQLEQEYGDRLLDRSGKHVAVTPAGRVLIAYAERLMQLREESKVAVADNGSAPRGKLVIGA